MTDTVPRAYDPKMFVHVADLHLAPKTSTINKKDPKTNRLVRDLDMENAFVASVDEALAQSPLPSAYVIAGDIFDTYRGSSDAFISVVRQIRRLRAAGIAVLGIAGNHDTPSNLLKTPMYSMLKNVFEDESPKPSFDEGTLSQLVRALGESGQDSDAVMSLISSMASQYEMSISDDDLAASLSNGRDEGVVLAYDSIEHVRIGDVEYVLLPHISCMKGGFTEEELKPETDAPYCVLVVHGVAAGDPSLQQMDEMKEIPIAKWILDMDWDYIAFGHYHKPGWIPGYAGKAAYCGSLENTVISGPDVAMRRGAVIVDLEKEGDGKYDMHVRRPRNIVQLPDIDLKDADVNAEELDQMICELILDADVDGAIVLHAVKNINRSLYKSLSRRNFQAVNPEMLYIKTSWEFAREAAASMRTVVEPGTPMSSAEEEEGEGAESAGKGAADAFLPLAQEVDEALDALIADGTIRGAKKDEIKDIIANLL